MSAATVSTWVAAARSAAEPRVTAAVAAVLAAVAVSRRACVATPSRTSESARAKSLLTRLFSACALASEARASSTIAACMVCIFWLPTIAASACATCARALASLAS